MTVFFPQYGGTSRAWRHSLLDRDEFLFDLYPINRSSHYNNYNLNYTRKLEMIYGFNDGTNLQMRLKLYPFLIKRIGFKQGYQFILKTTVYSIGLL